MKLHKVLIVIIYVTSSLIQGCNNAKQKPVIHEKKADYKTYYLKYTTLRILNKIYQDRNDTVHYLNQHFVNNIDRKDSLRFMIKPKSECETGPRVDKLGTLYLKSDSFMIAYDTTYFHVSELSHFLVKYYERVLSVNEWPPIDLYIVDSFNFQSFGREFISTRKKIINSYILKIDSNITFDDLSSYDKQHYERMFSADILIDVSN